MRVVCVYNRRRRDLGIMGVGVGEDGLGGDTGSYA